jgi:hypothetical protein
MLRSFARLAVVGALASPIVLTHATPSGATAFAVTDPVDDVTVAGTLRWAIAQAEGDATPPVIDLAPGLAVDVTCAGGGVLTYDSPGGQPLTINGNGATIRQTCPGDAVMAVDDDLAITDATITGGSAGGIVGESDVTLDRVIVEGNSGGPGVAVFTGTATVGRSVVRDNSGGIGGGVAGVFVVVEDSTLAGNSASSGAGVWSDQTATITNSTITGNTATGSGGGVLTTNSDATLAYSTITENSAPNGANVAMLTAGDLTSFASVVAAPNGSDSCALNAGVGTVTQGSNFTSDPSCGLELGAGDPMLGALADNGGSTPTRLPVSGSPLVDAADCAASPIAVDQRGTGRPQGSACDVGAVEIVPVAAPAPDETDESNASAAEDGDPNELPATGPRAAAVLVAVGSILVVAGVAATRSARETHEVP